MPYFAWDDEYSVNIDSIDEQHKKLIVLMNEFYDKMAYENEVDLKTLVHGLIDYTIYHFGYEEQLFAQHGFAQAGPHKRQHEEFIAHVNDYLARIESGGLLLTVEVTNYLKDWLVTHIKGSDKQYSDFLIARGVK